MQTITHERFLEQRGKEPKRRIFSLHSGVQKNKAKPSFSVKFYESIGPIYEADTNYRLNNSLVYGNYWNYLDTAQDIAVVEAWEAAQQGRVFLRDCLSCSIALNVNRDTPEAEERTEVGTLECNAKHNNDEQAISTLTGLLSDTIGSLPYYNSASLIAAVPPRPGKTTPDLPKELAQRIAQARGLTDLTHHIRYGGAKGQVKELSLEQRWPAWEAARLSLTDEGANLLAGHPIILIDDKYQSGVSANFVGMILQQYGASDVYGLYVVKTLRDTDND